MSSKPLDSLEGIYHYDKYYSVGLFKVNKTDYYITSLLKYELLLKLFKNWGSVFIILKKLPQFLNLKFTFMWTGDILI